MYKIFVINPGSTSTKVAYYEDDRKVRETSITHPAEELSKYSRAIEQLAMRKNVVLEFMQSIGITKLDAAISRGGPLKPLKSGVYRINESMLTDIREGRVRAEHISLVGPLIAYELTQKFGGIPMVADPISVDEFEPLARISGIPEIERQALQHTLNIKAVARKVAAKLGKKLDELNLVVTHIGGGISVCPLKKGKIVDTNNAVEEGPFSPERSGGLPVTTLVKLCFSGKYSYEWIRRRLVGNGGLMAYLGTNDLREVDRRIEAGDDYARLILEAMAYQIAKEIGAMSTVLYGEVDRIVLTGGGARCERLVNWIVQRVKFIAPVEVYPGEDEISALASAALRALRGEEAILEY